MEKREIRTVPIVALRGSVVFPHNEAILNFGRPKSKTAVQAAFSGDRLLAVFTQKDARIALPQEEDLYTDGTLVTVQEIMPTGVEVHALVRGVARIKLLGILHEDPFMLGRVEEQDMAEGKVAPSDEEKALARHIAELFTKAIHLGKAVEFNQTVMRVTSGNAEPAEVAYQVASSLEIKTSDKQSLLEVSELIDLLKKVDNYLSQELNIIELERSIAAKTQHRFEDQMRKAMLRERRRTIDEELREGEEVGDEIGELRKKIAQAGMPMEVEEKAKKEVERFSQMSPHNPERAYLENYLDWLVNVPWSTATSDNVSIEHAAAILDEDHYGLEKAKERILEFLAVMKVKQENRAKKRTKIDEIEKKDGKREPVSPTILCFIGPPGVGKTSIGRSIARSLGRKFVRISLGGVRDEAEIRGHRRTYVGALPGRIIQGMRNAGTKNPVFMLDEIDKIGADFRGDPSAALLEALDPEQNREFSDHYLEVPYDLSQVMFICTGNILDTIPPALRDRLEVIRFAGYTEEEKFHIANRYLWPKQLDAHGLDSKIDLKTQALKEVIRRYTRESGVRNLERNLATMCRKVARKIADGNGKRGKSEVHQISLPVVHEFLGPQKFNSLLAERADEVGITTGLAWTQVGGEILFVEVALMPGRGRLTLTGQLGEVMQESAKAAVAYARSHWAELGLAREFAKDIDVHIHVPSGAVPKDGPSAGVAIATALVSALTRIPVNRTVGMTGEVTLRGRVLEIGGVKEKVIAAHAAGLKTVILPQDNKKDLEEVPEKVRREIKFVFAAKVSDVLKIAFTRPLPEPIMEEPVSYLYKPTIAASVS